MPITNGADAKARRRPKAMNEAFANQILERIVGGETIRAICLDENLPARSTVYMELSENPDFAIRYGRAKFAAMESLADEILEISDESGGDWKQTHSGAKPDREVTERSKLRVETRKWLMARLSPTKYADRTIISDGTEPLSKEELAAQMEADKPVLAPDAPIPDNPVL